jgi:sec-independent protein translocase protein TatC
MPRNPEREMELWEHLAELRGRIIRSLLYIAIAMAICWMFYEPLKSFLATPLKSVPMLKDVKFIYRSVTEAFIVRMQVSLIAGLILALPFVTLELWGFVSPGLTPEERRGFHIVVPLSLMFFLLGVTTAYLILPSAFNWFASFIEKDSELLQNPVMYFTFVAKMMLAFGVVFQMPVVLMFLAWIGVVSSKMLKENWRTALVLTSVMGAVATPSQDPLSMMLMAVPLAALYFTSIWLVGIVERTRARHELQESAGLGTS